MGIYFDFTNEDTEKTFKKHLPKAEIAHNLALFISINIPFTVLQHPYLFIQHSICFANI